MLNTIAHCTLAICHDANRRRRWAEYDLETNDRGKRELVKTGVKMKVEGEFGSSRRCSSRWSTPGKFSLATGRRLHERTLYVSELTPTRRQGLYRRRAGEVLPNGDIRAGEVKTGTHQGELAVARRFLESTRLAEGQPGRADRADRRAVGGEAVPGSAAVLGGCGNPGLHP